MSSVLEVDGNGGWEAVEVTGSMVSVLHLGELLCVCPAALDLNLLSFCWIILLLYFSYFFFH